MDIFPLLCTVAVIFTGLTKGANVLPDGPLNVTVGETVMFNPTLTPPETPLSVNWKFGATVIINSDVDKNITDPEYEGRITLFISSGSLELRNVTPQDSGQYSVIIVRAKGQIVEANTKLDVYERISGASVTSETNLSIEGNSFNLSCDAGGSMISREWKKDGVKLTPDDHLSLQENNRVLTFNSLSRNDTGVYLCNVTNPVSQEGAEYKMVVYYGPENVQINGPSDIDLKMTLTLTCSAESVPASYTWMLNSTEIHNSAVYTKNNTEPSDGGNYICEVMNNVTGRTSTALHRLSVTVHPPGTSSPCSAGCIAGIVIAVLVILGAVCGASFFYYKKKPATKHSIRSPTAPTGAEGQDNKACTDLAYADITTFHRRDGGTVQLGVQPDASEYAQIRENDRPPDASSPPTYDDHLQRKKNQAPQPPSNISQLYAEITKN